MKDLNKSNFAVLMAGGVGSRFWPVSTAQKPKQFRDLLGTGETLIQTTFKRLSTLVPEENIYILTNQGYNGLVKEQLPQVHQEQIVLEPEMRNTAPAVLLAALKIQKKDPDAVMVMAPSDHWIEDEKAFSADIKNAFEFCRNEDRIVTLGIKPTFPNTGYGYIEFSGEKKVRPVKKFTEKPSFEKARDFLKQGNYLWNAGIFIWNVDFITRSFQKNLPEDFELFNSGSADLNTTRESFFIKDTYHKATNISIDYAIIEKEEETVFVIPAGFDWNDLGTWGSIYTESEKDGENNAVLNARIMAENSTGNIITSASNKVIVVDGLSDYIVVDEKEVLLIVPKEKEQEIKEIRTRVQEKFGEHLG
ncbi:mannose-1-phosphate guanylyltransferase [Salinimicrobium soli]|uniref:mannose-1-phosphate guanylyltransferase n=1 Tax=Salinimicrobium soli TaxID=1254399 RepID=UPI003AAB6A3F